MSDESPVLVVESPAHGTGLHNTQALLDLYADCAASGTRWLIQHTVPHGALLAFNFNLGFARALTRRTAGSETYFLLLHADVQPKTARWFSVLLREMRAHDADVISAVVPIKDQRGLTSTARDTDPWAPVRYTLAEVARQPATWTAPDLLVNTGLMLVDMRRDWVRRAYFTIRDAIVERPDGEWEVRVAPEDWEFSRLARRLGARIFATRAVAVTHLGLSAYDSDVVWGQETDTGNLAVLAQRRLAEAERVVEHAEGNGDYPPGGVAGAGSVAEA